MLTASSLAQVPLQQVGHSKDLREMQASVVFDSTLEVMEPVVCLGCSGGRRLRSGIELHGEA